ncbi:sulfonate ABC transporter substrate-binding protein [Desmospora activa]|uniref:sulfonate ABC transporter substrate-binding protein n=1 Tax=Desmospora activa TaxID=500615 RepID=UPI001FE340D5|nr:sulfonate ABC transporter substrate-binding protein [Desmospora activa]
MEWTEFPAGPQLLEALNVGSIDIGHTGNAPPIFAQAAGTPLTYIGVSSPKPETEAIVVHNDSPIKSVKDLKGKKVVLNKGSNVHYLLVRALEDAGLQYEDIEPVYLPPADARAAFSKKSVDAWVVWDPYYASAEEDLGVRTITDATGYTSNREFVFAEQEFADNHSAEVKILLEELKKTADWFNDHPEQTAKQLAEQIKMDPIPVEKAITRTEYGMEPINDDVLKDQQQVADTFARIGLIPKKIQVEEVIWPENRVKK